MASAIVRIENKTSEQLNQSTRYTTTKINLTEQLIKNYKEKGEATMLRDSAEAKAIFKTLSESEFIRLLD